MQASLSEYLRIVVRTWWARVSLLAGAVGLASELTNLVVPSYLWWILVGLAVVLAQFTAFHHVRAEREELRAEIAEEEAIPEAPTFTPNLFDGRLFPTSFYPVIESSERGFVIRGAFAFALPPGYDQLGSEVQKLFENTVASSAFEGWMQRQMDTIRRVPNDQWWERIQPTTSQIVTVGRPAACLPHYDFTLAGHCVLNLKPGIQPWHAGYGEVLASAVIRPADADESTRGLPLSLQDLYDAINIIEAALVGQIVPSLVEKITGAEMRAMSFALLAIANGGGVSDYVGLNHHHWPRASGSYDRMALYGSVASEETLNDSALREQEIKGWLARFLTDGGFSDFEPDIERLQASKLPEPLPT